MILRVRPRIFLSANSSLRVIMLANCVTGHLGSSSTVLLDAKIVVSNGSEIVPGKEKGDLFCSVLALFTACDILILGTCNYSVAAKQENVKTASGDLYPRIVLDVPVEGWIEY